MTWGIKIAKLLVEMELFPSNQSGEKKSIRGLNVVLRLDIRPYFFLRVRPEKCLASDVHASQSLRYS